MFRLACHTLAASIITTTMLLGTEVRADAVTDRMKGAMADCVVTNVSRIGAPIEDARIWSDVVAAFTAVSFSMVKLFGTGDYANIEEAMVARTRDTLISSLEDRGFTGFRSQAIETIQHCMPFALAAASGELMRQEDAVCPDDTDYVNSVEIITASEVDLRRQYGDRSERVRGLSLFQINLITLGAFPEIFRYGQDDYPAFEGGGSIKKLHDALSAIELEKMGLARPLVDVAFDGLNDIEIRTDRIDSLRTELICFKDWLDIYPAAEILELTTGK